MTTHWYHDCPGWRRGVDTLAVTPDEVACLTCIADMRHQGGLLPFHDTDTTGGTG